MAGVAIGCIDNACRIMATHVPSYIMTFGGAVRVRADHAVTEVVVMNAAHGCRVDRAAANYMTGRTVDGSWETRGSRAFGQRCVAVDTVGYWSGAIGGSIICASGMAEVAVVPMDGADNRFRSGPGAMTILTVAGPAEVRIAVTA